MKTIVVQSKQEARNYKCDEPWIAISISTQKGEWPSIPIGNRQGLLQLHFQDSEFPGRATISPNQAEEIVRFVREHDVSHIMVHCEMGRSRSPAIAAALANIFNEGNDQAFFQPPYTPNMLVYRLVLNAADRV